MEPNVYEPSVQLPSKEKEELGTFEKKANKYRFYLLLADKLMRWEPNYAPGIALAVVTLVFAITWYFEPSLMTLVSLTGLLVCLLEYAAPLLSNHFHRQPEQWNKQQEDKFKNVCERLLNGKKHLCCTSSKLCSVKSEKPNTFLLGLAGVFLVAAWVGTFLDGLLLVYLIVVGLLLVPGLREHGVFNKVTDLVKSKLNKPKSN